MTRRPGKRPAKRPAKHATRSTSSRTSRQRPPASIQDVAMIAVQGATTLLEVDDPLEAERWASELLGMFYKLPLPLDGRDEIDRDLVPALVAVAEARGDAAGLAALEALAAVAEPAITESVRDAAARMRERGLSAPAWADELGTATLEGAWLLTDVFGDYEGWYATFRYPGRPLHLVDALVDMARGEIVKDAGVGQATGDPGTMLADLVGTEPGMSIVLTDPATMARRVIDAVASGDSYLDNDWTERFKGVRALLLARMRSLPLGAVVQPPEVTGAERDEIIDAFLADSDLPAGDAEIVASLCLDYTCDHLGEGPYRWSPIVVEQFLLDFIPRKVSLTLPEVRAVPDVLRAWVRFALGRRGLEQRWIDETLEAIDTFEGRFLLEATHPDAFGPAKSIAARMQADGVDLGDPGAVDAWIRRSNDAGS